MKLDRKKLNLVFDFDGVIANSNGLKSRAFADVLKFFGLPNQQELVEYNKNYGGITAKEKFRHYAKEIYPKCKIPIEELENKFRDIISSNLSDQEYEPFVSEFHKYHEKFNFHVISGGNENEIKAYLEKNKILSNFNGLILGNPMSKFQNFQLFSKSCMVENSIYFADSFSDAELSNKFKMRFIFISHWSEEDPQDERFATIKVHASIKDALEKENVI